MEDKLLPKNEPLPIVSTESGMRKEVNPEQQANTRLPMLLTVLGNLYTLIVQAMHDMRCVTLLSKTRLSTTVKCSFLSAILIDLSYSHLMID